MFTSFDLGCRVRDCVTGVVYVKAAPQQWLPTIEAGQVPLVATDDSILESGQYKPLRLRGELIRKRQPSLLDCITGNAPSEAD